MYITKSCCSEALHIVASYVSETTYIVVSNWSKVQNSSASFGFMFPSPAITLSPTGQNSNVSFAFMFQSPAISLDLTVKTVVII